MTDPRPLLHRALDQYGALADATPDADLDVSTPCAGWDVRALLGHLVSVHRKLALVARGGSPFDIPHVTEVADADREPVLAEARADLDRAWADDSVLDRELMLPWGTMPGRVAALGYALELTVHAWDLATVTGRAGALDPGLAEVCLENARRMVPAEPRGDQVRFEPVVEIDDTDEALGPYERLVAWLGRDPSPWRDRQPRR